MKVPGYRDYGHGCETMGDLSDVLPWLLNPLGTAVYTGLTDEPARATVTDFTPGGGSSSSGSGSGGQLSSADQVKQDAANLRRLGYNAPDTGDAYNSGFRAAVRAFQAAAGLEADGLIGPNTRTAIAAKLGTSPSLPSLPSLSLPGVTPAGGGSTTPEGMSTTTMALIGAGVVAVGGAVIWAMSSGPKRRANPSRPRRRRRRARR